MSDQRPVPKNQLNIHFVSKRRWWPHIAENIEKAKSRNHTFSLVASKTFTTTRNHDHANLRVIGYWRQRKIAARWQNTS